jgi:hypothetical protein
MKKFYIFMVALVIAINAALATVGVAEAQAKPLNEAIRYENPEYSGEITNPMVRLLTKELNVRYGNIIEDISNTRVERTHLFYCTFRQQNTSEGVRYVWIANGMSRGSVRRDYLMLTVPDITRLLGKMKFLRSFYNYHTEL